MFDLISTMFHNFCTSPSQFYSILLLSSSEAPPPTGAHNSFPSYTYTMTNSGNLVNNDAATPIGLPMPYFDFDPELTGRSTAPNSIIGGSPSDDSLDVDIAPSQIQHNNTTEQSNAPSQLQESDSSLSRYKRIYNKAGRFYHQNSFLILVTCAILLAYAYPPLGAKYVAPKITATWIAVIFIFILAGMGIRTEELTKALQRVYFNSFVQVFNFMVTWPKLTSAFRPRYMSIKAGLKKTPRKLPKAASKIAAASSPPTNFVNTMPIFTLTESVEVIVIPSAKLSGNAFT